MLLRLAVRHDWRPRTYCQLERRGAEVHNQLRDFMQGVTSLNHLTLVLPAHTAALVMRYTAALGHGLVVM